MNCSSCKNEVATDAFFCQRCDEFLPAPQRGGKANLFRRYVALAMDPLIAVLAYGAAMLAGGMIGSSGGEETAVGATLFFAVLFPIAYLVLFLFMLRKGLTPGKKLLGLQVVHHQTGAIPGFGTMFVREIVGRPLSGLIFGFGYLSALWDKNGQAWHDKLAGTVVLRARPIEGDFASRLEPVHGAVPVRE